jgi:hypothetical protein
MPTVDAGGELKAASASIGITVLKSTLTAQHHVRQRVFRIEHVTGGVMKTPNFDQAERAIVRARSAVAQSKHHSMKNIPSSMSRKSGNRFSLTTNARGVCAEINPFARESACCFFG